MTIKKKDNYQFHILKYWFIFILYIGIYGFFYVGFPQQKFFLCYSHHLQKVIASSKVWTRHIHCNTLCFNTNLLFEWLHFGLHPSQMRSNYFVGAMLSQHRQLHPDGFRGLFSRQKKNTNNFNCCDFWKVLLLSVWNVSMWPMLNVTTHEKLLPMNSWSYCVSWNTEW